MPAPAPSSRSDRPMQCSLHDLPAVVFVAGALMVSVAMVVGFLRYPQDSGPLGTTLSVMAALLMSGAVAGDWFQVVRVHPRTTYRGRVWLDGDRVDDAGDAVERHGIDVRTAGQQGRTGADRSGR